MPRVNTKGQNDVLKGGIETALSMFGNAGFDIASLIGAIGQEPTAFYKGFGNREEANIFATEKARVREMYPEFGVSETTEEIQQDFMKVPVDLAKSGWNSFSATNPNAAEGISDYFNDPRVQHTLESSIFAAPAFGRFFKQLKNVPENIRNLNSGGGKQKGFILPAEEAIKRSDAAGMTDLSTKLAINHQIAQQMLDAKHAAVDISEKTGFHPIPDNMGEDQLFWEVTGKTTPTGKAPELGDQQHKLTDYYENEMLFSLVPELKDMNLKFNRNYDVGEGFFNRDRNLLGLGIGERNIDRIDRGDVDSMTGVAVHEIAHRGANMFDMDRGGSPDMFRTGSAAPLSSLMLNKPPESLQDITNEIARGTSAGELINQYSPTRKVVGALEDIDARQKTLKEHGNIFDDDPEMDMIFAQDFRNQTSTNFQKYQQLAGEASANADMVRNQMGDKARQSVPYAAHMAQQGGVINPRLLRYRDQQDYMPWQDTQKVNPSESMFGGKQRGAINLLSGAGINVKPYGTSSTRIPSASQQFKQGIDAHGTGNLLVSSALLSPEKRTQLADIYRTYPALQNIDPLDTEGALEETIDFMSGNLDDILTIMPDKWREKSMDWYEGYNRIAQNAAKSHNATNEQAGSIIAVLSPQTDWNMNLTRADRIMDTWNTRQDFAWSPEMEAQMPNLSKSINQKKYKDKLGNIRGKKLKDLDGSEEKAMWIRAYDQAHNSREYNLYNPDGSRGELATKKGGVAREANWASTSVIDKAVKILEDGSPENISRQLGSEHKVRSFNRNAADPYEPTTTTMDTHAIATALMQPLSGNKPKDMTLPYYEEVPQNFGVGMSDARTGMSGTYPINQDAYNRVAGKYGIEGRAVQSPTWEFGRAMMHNQKTPAQKRYADHVWRGYADGKLSRKEAFDLIVKSFGMPESPY